MAGVRLAARPGWARVFWSVALFLAPFFATVTLGPGAFAEAVSATDFDHGHSHVLDGKASASHDATDHEHQNFALIPRADQSGPGSAAQDMFIDASFASGLERDGPRRPPRPGV